MRRCLVTAALIAALPVAFFASPSTRRADRIWFSPGPGTVDMLRLFDEPDTWARARSVMDVFKFYQGHTRTVPTPGEGPNQYEAFVRADAFRKLMRWGKHIAIEAAAVKEFYCTPDGSGMQQSIDDTLEALRNVRDAGGIVSYIDMDEPFTSGLSRRCGGPSPVPTADRLAVYVPAIRRAFPAVRIGLIEPYPTFSPEQFSEMLQLLHDRGVDLDFLHIDPLKPPPSVEPDVFGAELIQLRDVARRYGIPFGVIIWGDNGQSDALYAADARRAADALKHVFRAWEVTPDHLIVQSWAQSATGQFITPSNLPETAADTHTALLLEFYDLFRRVRIPSSR